MPPSTRRRAARPAPAALVIALALALLAGLVVPSPAAAEGPPRYEPPVDAPVVDPFRAPTTPYGPGNRGLEYGTTAGAEVRAAADGEVTFAGMVAGTRHVTVLHPDGLRTTVSGLASVEVVIGQRVRRGDLLGTAAGPVHFGARRGEGYLDPASLFATEAPRVRLVPFDLPPGIGIGGERSAIRQLLGLPDAVADWAGEHGGELGRLVVDVGTGLVDNPYVDQVLAVLDAVEVIGEAWEQATRECTEADVEVPPPAGRRIALLVGGLGSSSTKASIDDLDTASLGYEAADTLRFSYRGGRTPGSTGVVPGVPANHYDARESQQDLRVSGRRLADLVEQVAAANPGVPVDLLAHSQGGLVARLAVEELRQRGAVDALGLLATIATPHQGANLATAARLVEHASVVRDEVVDRSLGALGIDTDSEAVRQLAETSDLIAELGDTPLPPGLAAISIGARGDAVVPVPRTGLEGATSVVVPPSNPFTAHSDAPGDATTRRELALAIAGRPPGCRSYAAAVLDQAAGYAISEVEDLGAFAVAFAGPRLP